MTAEEFSEAIQPLVEELKAIREALGEIREDIQWAVRNAQDYLSAINDAADEIRGEVLARVRWDDLPKPHLPLEETIACAHCDADSPRSLAEAVELGWSRLQSSDGIGEDYLGQCPDCAKKIDEVPAQRELF